MIKKLLALLLAAACMLSLCACGAKKEEITDTEVAEEIKTVEVSDVDGLLDAIGPNTEIVLAPGRYNITKAALYGKPADNRYISWNSYGFAGEYELCVYDADNLTIRGDHAEIVTVPRNVNVMYFNCCSGLVLEGIKIGHTEAAQPCQSGVVYLKGCRNARIENCGLYGCGTIGIRTDRADSLTVSDCDIYSCSSSAFSFTDSLDLTVEKCRIYDCGVLDGMITASSVMNMNRVKGAKISQCNIYDNFGYSLIWQYESSDIEVSETSIKGNKLDNMFSTADISWSSLEIEGNTFDEWLTEGLTETSVDGKKLSSEALESLYPNQLARDGTGTVVDVKPVELVFAGTETVHVSTADEFINAIASNTYIVIDVPKIDLTEAKNYGKDAAEEYYYTDFSNGPCVWETVYDGYQLAIGGVSNLHISGGEIVTRPGYANVLSFWNCTDISLDNVTLGHDREPGSCCGGVVYLKSCSSVVLESCDLYGCGVTGVQTYDTYNLNVQNTRIHDCSYSAAEIDDSGTVNFIGCTIENCPEPGIILYNCEGFTWDGKVMDSYAAFTP